MGRRVVVSEYKERAYNGDYMKLGRLAESVIRDWLTDHPDVIKLTDATDMRVMQDIEADFTVQTNDGQRYLAEIKYDSHLGKSGNVLVEVMRINHKAQPQYAAQLGWSVRTQATWVLYYSPHLAYVYQFRSVDLRAGFQRYTGIARQNVNIVWINTDIVKSTINVLVPMEYYVKPHVVFEVHDVEQYAQKHQPADYQQQRMQLKVPLFA